MNFLDKLQKNTCITILPHDCIDVDSAVSSILLAKILDFYNIPNEILIFDDNVDKWTRYFLNKLGHDLSKYFAKDECKTRNLFLVDHYKTSHKGTVISCIDHHFTSEDVKYDYYLYKESCSTAYIIYKIMLDLNIPITKEIVALVGYASLVDTCSFKSTKTVLKEKNEILDLLKLHDFNIDEMIKECLCLDDLKQMTLEEITLNGVKKYNYNGHIVKSSYIQIDSLEISNDVVDHILNLVITKGLDMWVFIIYDMVNEQTKLYKITKNETWVEEFHKIMSRGKDIMPIVENKFCS